MLEGRPRAASSTLPAVGATLVVAGFAHRLHRQRGRPQGSPPYISLGRPSRCSDPLWQNVDHSRACFGLKGGVTQTYVGLLTRGDAASLFLPSLKVAPTAIIGRIIKLIR